MNPTAEPSSILGKHAHADQQEESQSKRKTTTVSISGKSGKYRKNTRCHTPPSRKWQRNISGRLERVDSTLNTNRAETTKQISKPETTAIEGKHIAKRGVSEWLDYGDSKIWDAEFEKAVLEAVTLVQNRTLKSVDLIGYFEKKRNEIAVKRQNKKSFKFGLRRDDPSQFSKVNYARTYYTPLCLTSPYGYALGRACMIPYDGEHYVEKQSSAGQFWSDRFYPFPSALKYGLVQGKIEDQNIPLTQYVFAPRIKKYEAEVCFGNYDKDYISSSDGLKSAIWLHPEREIIPQCMEYIHEMLKKALSGDLTVIPKIHWWYVHLAPTWRGAGGIAEMLTNTLCRVHGVDLPPWKEGVAPSVEVLLEPDEERFCSNYHQLFENNQLELKGLFKASD